MTAWSLKVHGMWRSSQLFAPLWLVTVGWRRWLPQEYEELVVRLAQSVAHLRRLRALVTKASLTAPLFDSRAHTADLERAFRAMSELRCRATSPGRGSWRREIVVHPAATSAPAAADAAADTLMRVVVPALHEAVAAFEAGDFVGAAFFCSRVLNAYPGVPDALYLLGTAHITRGEVASGVRLIDEALAALPSAAVCASTCGDAARGPAHWRCMWCGVDSSAWSRSRADAGTP